MKGIGRLLVRFCAVSFLCFFVPFCGHSSSAEPTLQAGFAEVDITPKVGDRPVYLAGFGKDRKATGVHDPLMARAVVLRHGEEKIAWVSLDLVCFFHANVAAVRDRLPGFRHVLVISTHNHEGPDTLGLWGPGFKSGVDPDYPKLVEERTVKVVQEADRAAGNVTARIGSVQAPELVRDARLPIVKHDELVALQFLDVKTGNGAFMQKQADAVKLAKTLVGIGRGMGRKVSALITDMNQTLGRAVGNANEVAESIDCLKGGGPEDLMIVTRALTVPGYLHDQHSMAHIFIQANPLLKNDELQLKAKHGLSYAFPELPMMSVFEDGTTLGLYRDREKSCAEIAKFSKKDAETYRWLAAKAAGYLPMIAASLSPIRP